MMPPKPTRAKYAMTSTITSSYEVAQSVYEDPDALLLALTVGSQPEVRVRPVPLPRSKLQPKSNNNTADSVDPTRNNTTDTETSQISDSPADYKRPVPVRPPPRPPISQYMTSTRATVDVDNLSISEPNSPTVSSERIKSLFTPRPERPPPPSNSYSSRSTMMLKSKSEDKSCCSYMSHIPHSPASPVLYEEEMDRCGTCSTTDTDSTDRPAVPPRLRASSVPCSASLGETSPSQIRPPPPSFNPPPPPSAETPSETLSCKLEHRPYLDVLPEDGDKMTQGKSTLRHQSGSFSPRPHNLEDIEDINGMLRWLKRVSKPGFMSSSMYGLSIEEEIRSFTQGAINVRKALRLYNLLMMKRNESLRNTITEFTSISDSLDKMKKKGKTMEIAGGTTGAIGGVTAVLGIALAPATLGTSLIATAIGAGMVVSAGGIGAHNAKAKKKTVNKMTIEKLVYDYKGNVVDLEHCLGFILSEMNELQRHDIARLQRAGVEPDALKMGHLSQFVYRNNRDKDRGSCVAVTCGMSSERLLLAFTREIDQYFTEKDDQKLSKSSKSKFSGRVRLLAENLKEELYHLNRMWEMFG